MVIGRSDQADITLNEDGVSRSHARIDRHENSYMLVDLGSTNGTYVNGDPIEQKVLTDGDKVRIGDVLLRFAYQDLVDVNYQETLRDMAMRDGLTKAYNRRYFSEMLGREISFASRKTNALELRSLSISIFLKTLTTPWGMKREMHGIV